VDRVDVYQLHTPDPHVPFADSVGELARLRDEGKVAHVGLSNVSVREIEEATGIVPIVSVQNLWNPGHRAPETDGVLAHCARFGIAFLPYSPFGGSTGALTLANLGTLGAFARGRGISPHRLVLAWMLAKSPVVITIPGSRRAETATDSAAATDVVLSPADLLAVERSFAS
jgi:aryl-alcohol dehydrogenase-like predicted oxidoreductase